MAFERIFLMKGEMKKVYGYIILFIIQSHTNNGEGTVHLFFVLVLVVSGLLGLS
jgi:hypothetical protein